MEAPIPGRWSVDQVGEFVWTAPAVVDLPPNSGSVTVLTVGFVACGAAVMVYASLWTRRLIESVDHPPVRRTWRVLFGLMVFFVVGYLGTIALVWTRNLWALVPVTGVVFGGGAVFVLLVVRTSHDTVDRLVETTVSREFLNDVLASMGDALLIVSRDGRVQEANPAAGKLFGLEPGKLVGRTVDDFFVGNAAAIGVGDDPATTDGEATVVTVSGETVPVLYSASTLSADSHDGRGVVCIVRDITGRKRREEALRRQNDRLDEFASVISHDLRNPLGIAQGHLDLARETGSTEHFRTVDCALERIESLVDGLLRLARQGQTVGESRPVPLGEVVDGAWRTVETEEASLRVTGELGSVEADEDRLRQALENLFRNALDHAGSRVTVTVSPLADAPGFAVEDDGPGVPADERGDVFDYGYSTDETGTGFGLAIVRTVVEAHGWDVSLTEGDGGGARFEIRTAGAFSDPTGVEAAA
ncbi:two-component system sensor histidine kinase NtrB [Salinigranum salinum]|uniref:two-component system sensor histidine kinase NtrB n=1 Tax=Salinigranum salinum TaxID=1364937 RepID=UPI0012608463|nr:PAS domain-containing sensor histidine kinase [Salinigranum salinum]